MLNKNTMTNVAIKLANSRIMEHCAHLDTMFLERCELLDTKLASSLKEAFDGEKISQVRMQRIVDRFCGHMLDGKNIEKAS